MNVRLLILFNIIMQLAPCLLHAQTPIKISGKVIDEHAKPLPGATVTLLRPADSSQIKVIATTTDGIFVFDNIQEDSLVVIVSAVSYHPYTSSIIQLRVQALPVEVPVIQLKKRDAGTLQQVTVVGKKNLIEQEIDKMVVNVDAMISATGSSALEVLEKTPGVTVDENGSINVKGKSGVTVYINNKPSYLSGPALANYLKSIPASQLDKIEIMTNPSARYDAAGTGGIVNLKMKKSKIKGFNGSLSASFGQSVYWQTNENMSLNYRNDKITIFGSVGFSRQNGWRKLDVERHYFNDNHDLTYIYDQTTYFKTASRAMNEQVGIDYRLTDKTSIGIVYSGAHYRSSENRNITTFFYNPLREEDSSVMAFYRQRAQFNRSGFNINISHQFDTTGRSLNFDFDYILYGNKNNLDFQNDNFLPNHILKSTDLLQANTPTAIHIYSYKADYNFFLLPKLKTETGVKSGYISTDNEANYFDIINSEPYVNSDFTNHFTYKEYINAAYINLNRSFNRFTVQSGLRLENTIMKGHQLGNNTKPDSSFKRTYTNLFPTLYLSYKLDKKENHQLNFSLGRRITRPYYQDLNPFMAPLDKYSFFAGNPYLLPEYSTNLELSWFFKKKILTTLMYNYAKNWQAQTSEQTSTIYINRPGNIGNRTYMGISVNASLQPAQLWTCNIYTELIKNNFKGNLYGSHLDESAVYWYINTNNQFKLGHGWSAELSGFYITPSVSGQYKKESIWQVNTGIQKNILDNKINLKISSRDIFHTLRPNAEVTNLNNATASIRNVASTQVIVLGVTYNFGKNFNNGRRRKTGGAQSEQNRIKDIE